jgi:RNA polymerase sigma factor (sigma-70 family)
MCWAVVTPGDARMAEIEGDNRAEPEMASPTEESRHLWVERLFSEHNASLVKFLRTRLRSNEEAREVAQEAYVRLLQLDKPQAVSYFRAFLFKTAGNIAIDRLRKDARDRNRSVFPFFEVEAPSTEQTESQRETIRRVSECLDDLPPKCAKAFLLSRIYGMTTREVASQMHMTPRMIRNYLVQATLHIEGCLEEGHGDRNE